MPKPPEWHAVMLRPPCILVSYCTAEDSGIYDDDRCTCLLVSYCTAEDSGMYDNNGCTCR